MARGNQNEIMVSATGHYLAPRLPSLIPMLYARDPGTIAQTSSRARVYLVPRRTRRVGECWSIGEIDLLELCRPASRFDCFLKPDRLHSMVESGFG